MGNPMPPSECPDQPQSSSSSRATKRKLHLSPSQLFAKKRAKLILSPRTVGDSSRTHQAADIEDDDRSNRLELLTGSFRSMTEGVESRMEQWNAKMDARIDKIRSQIEQIERGQEQMHREIAVLEMRAASRRRRSRWIGGSQERELTLFLRGL